MNHEPCLNEILVLSPSLNANSWTKLLCSFVKLAGISSVFLVGSSNSPRITFSTAMRKQALSTGCFFPSGFFVDILNFLTKKSFMTFGMNCCEIHAKLMLTLNVRVSPMLWQWNAISWIKLRPRFQSNIKMPTACSAKIGNPFNFTFERRQAAVDKSSVNLLSRWGRESGEWCVESLLKILLLWLYRKIELIAEFKLTRFWVGLECGVADKWSGRFLTLKSRSDQRSCLSASFSIHPRFSKLSRNPLKPPSTMPCCLLTMKLTISVISRMSMIIEYPDITLSIRGWGGGLMLNIEEEVLP